MAAPTAALPDITCKKGGLRLNRSAFRSVSLPLSRPIRKGYWSRRLPSTNRGALTLFAQIGLFYSTSTGHTEDVAGLIKTELGDEATEPSDIGDATVSSLAEYDGLVVGAPTWNTGADSERSGTAWDNLLDDIKGLDLSGKKVAVFGLGDSLSYGDYFCDAMEEIYTLFKGTGATMVGHWPTEGYQHEDSKALLDEGTFCGLALDEDNEDDQTLPRVKKWVEQLKGEGLPA